MGLTTHIVKGASPERLLLLMHGLRSDERDLGGLVPHLDPNGKFLAVMPRAPYAAAPGYAWFHMDRPELLEAMSRSSLDAADDALDQACADYGFSRDQAVVGGFSQGAAMAVAMGYRASTRPRPAGVLCMSGFGLPFAEDVSQPAPPALIQHGTADDILPVEAGRDLAAWLSQAGVPVVYREYAMAHEVTMDTVTDAASWLDRVASGERPSEPVDVPLGDRAEPVGVPPAAGAEPVAPPAHAGPVRTLRPQDLQAVVSSQTPTIVEFWSQQSGRPMADVVQAVVVMRKGRYVGGSFNVDQAPQITQQLKLPSLPAVAMFRNGRMERVSVGVKPRAQLESELGMLVIP